MEKIWKGHKVTREREIPLPRCSALNCCFHRFSILFRRRRLFASSISGFTLTGKLPFLSALWFLICFSVFKLIFYFRSLFRFESYIDTSFTSSFLLWPLRSLYSFHFLWSLLRFCSVSVICCLRWSLPYEFGDFCFLGFRLLLVVSIPSSWGSFSFRVALSSVLEVKQLTPAYFPGYSKESDLYGFCFLPTL